MPPTSDRTARYDTRRDARRARRETGATPRRPSPAPPFASPFFLHPSVSQSLDVTRVGRSRVSFLNSSSRGQLGHSLRTNNVSRNRWVLCCDRFQWSVQVTTRWPYKLAALLMLYEMRAWAHRMTCYETLRAPAPAADAPMAHHFVKWWRNKFRNGYKKFSSKLIRVFLCLEIN